MIASPAELMRRHPCFDEQAHARVGRVHLPVAPRCNIQCVYCERRVCTSLTAQHPGWSRQMLSPEEAAARVRQLVQRRSEAEEKSTPSFVVGVAGPAEPLANPETLETLRLVHAEFPWLMKCISTNGLLLEEQLPQLVEVGVRTLTVTVNAVDDEVGQHVYAWVRHAGTIYRGREAARILITHQLQGIRAAIAAGIVVKANTVLMPGINSGHVVHLARRLGELGVHLMNIMPLIPAGQLRDHLAPTCEALERARADCEEFVPQFRSCQQCRADIICFPLAVD